MSNLIPQTTSHREPNHRVPSPSPLNGERAGVRGEAVRSISGFNEITELTRRDFLVSTARGVGGLAFAKLLEADGLLAADASKNAAATPSDPLAVKPPHF